MSATSAVAEQLLVDIKTAESAATAAVRAQVRSLMRAVGVLADQYAPQQERLVVFRARFVPMHDELAEDSHDCGDPECSGDGPSLVPELTQVEVHTASTTHALAAGGVDGTWWELAVSVWLGLRESVTLMTLDMVGGGLVIDPDNHVFAAWLGEHCPDVGPLPERLLDLSACVAEVEHDKDPFMELLDDDSLHLDAAEDLILGRMDAFKVDPPSVPAHDPDDPCC